MKKFKSVIRATSFVLAFVLFFTFSASAFAANESHMSRYYEQYQKENVVVNGSFENPQRFVPALPWIGMGVGELLKWLLIGAGTVAIIYEAGEAWVKVTDFAKELANSNQKDKPRFFVALPKYGDKAPMLIGKPLYEGEAEAWLKASINNDVWAASEKDAKGLAMRVGQGKFAGPEIHFQNGRRDTLYYYHYHGGDNSNRVTGHIFYGSHGLPGLK